jgi:hypothetical protein
VLVRWKSEQPGRVRENRAMANDEIQAFDPWELDEQAEVWDQNCDATRPMLRYGAEAIRRMEQAYAAILKNSGSNVPCQWCEGAGTPKYPHDNDCVYVRALRYDGEDPFAEKAAAEKDY